MPAERVLSDPTSKGSKAFSQKCPGDCEYYPCHFHGHDCTFCFCPFYPCPDGLTGGRYVVSKKTGKEVWSCKKCDWIHKKDIVVGILLKLEEIPKDDRKRMLELRLKFL